MANDYRSVPAEGQFDQFSCWAACLAWWLRAVRGGRPSWNQAAIISEYNKYCGDDGSFPPEEIMRVWQGDARLKMSCGVFKTSEYRFARLPLGDSPVMIAFNYPLVGGTHMNVVFGLDSQMNARKLTAMEPYFPYPGTDGRRTGRFEERTADFYIKESPNIILFWPTVTFDKTN
jgi:hypothetical protein